MPKFDLRDVHPCDVEGYADQLPSAWEIYTLFANAQEAAAAGMYREWRDAEDQIHVADYEQQLPAADKICIA